MRPPISRMRSAPLMRAFRPRARARCRDRRHNSNDRRRNSEARRNEVATGRSKRSAKRAMPWRRVASSREPPRMTIGALGARKHGAERARCRRAPARLAAGSTRGASATAAVSVSMSSGSAITTGPGRPCMATRKARATSSGMRSGRSISTDPFRHRAEHGLVVDLLERLALAHAGVDLADEQDHRRRILHRDVDAVAGIGRAGAAGDEADAGPAGQLAIGLGHHRGAAFGAADHDVDRAVMQRVERGEIAFARHAGDALDALRDELVDQDLAAGAGVA